MRVPSDPSADRRTTPPGLAVHRAQPEAPGRRHGPAPGRGGDLEGVVPVRHPGDADPLVVGGPRPGPERVVVGAVIGPAELAVRAERRPVEVADEVPGAG